MDYKNGKGVFVNCDHDWHDEANWYKANPSLGQTIQIQRVRDAYQEALDNPAEENVFKQLRLNMWVSSLTRFIPEHIYLPDSAPADRTVGSECADGGGIQKKPRKSEREMTTPLFLLRCVQLGISIADLDLLTIGLVNDMFTERQNDDYPYKELASQADFDRF